MAFDKDSWNLQQRAMRYVETREFPIAYPIFSDAMNELDEPDAPVRTVEQAARVTQFAVLLGSLAFAHGVNGIYDYHDPHTDHDEQQSVKVEALTVTTPTHLEAADQLFEKANAVSERALNWLSAKPESTPDERRNLYAHLARIQQWYGRYQTAQFARSGDTARAEMAQGAYDAAYMLGLKSGDQKFGFDTVDAAMQLEVLRGGKARLLHWLGRVARIQISGNNATRADDGQVTPVDYSRQFSTSDRVRLLFYMLEVTKK